MRFVTNYWNMRKMRKLLYASAAPLTLAVSLLSGTVALNAHATEAAVNPAQPLVKTANFILPDVGDLVERVGPAVVNISVVKQQKVAAYPLANDPLYDFLRRFGMPPPGPQGNGGPQISRGIGSGFIISEDGYVLTNAHVVGEADQSTEVTVKLTDKREFTAKIVGTDPRTDIAVLKIEANDLPVVKMGDPEHARVGEWVVAVGSPFGFDNTVTAGIISAKARRLPDENYVPFIQTDVAINPGNSGGPLFNLSGEVIGINSQIYSRSGGFMGISFAIPIDVALNVKQQLIDHGRVQRGKLGVIVQGVNNDLAQSFGLPKTQGALISRVEPGSAAEKGGLQPGDVVLGVDGVDITDSSDLSRLIGEKRPGVEVKLQIWRDGATSIVSVALDDMNPELTVGDSATSGGPLGLSVRPLSREETVQLGVNSGLSVQEVSGAAERAGLRAGDVILALNNQGVTDLGQFRQLLQRAGNRFALLVQRGGARIFLPVKID